MTNNVSLPSLKISKTVIEIPEALSIYVNQLVYDLKRRGQDIVTLSLGEAFFDIPLFDFNKVDVAKGYHYSDSQGIPELRKQIAAYYQRQYGANVDYQSEMLITAGSKVAIFMAMQVVLEPGDEVVIHEPAWLSYQEQARLVGAKPRFIPFDVPVERFGEYLSEKTGMLVINNPNNPAGRLYTADELKTIQRICRANGTYVLVDEAYSDFVGEGTFPSMARVIADKDGVIVVNSLSKNFGISGWRVGYVIAQPNIISALLKVNQHLITCGSSLLLYYLARYFDKLVDLTLPQVREVVEKRQRVMKMLDEFGFQRLAGSCTFYTFVSIEDFPGSSLDFALSLLLDHGIAVVPGSAYGESTARFVRLSIGTESEERIHEALMVMRDLVNSRQFDHRALAQRMAEYGFHHFKPGTG